LKIKFEKGLFAVFLMLIMLFCFLETKSQKVNFRHLNINDGLSQNAVFAILQDSKGFIWFGTKDGLNRYDGYSFKVYQHNPFDTTTLSANYITALFEDSQKNIWVGTLNGGLNCLHPGSESFRRISLSFTIDSLQSDPEILSFSEDVTGSIWVGTNKYGLFRLSIVNENGFEITKRQFLNHPEKIRAQGIISIPALFVDSGGTLWAGASNGLYRFNPQIENFTFFEIISKNPKAPESPDQKMVRSIINSNDGNLWLGTLSGLVHFEKETGKYRKYPHHYEVFRYGWGIIQQIEQDHEGLLWLATPGGLMRFNPKIFKYEYFTNDPFDSKSISDNIVASLCVDKTGMLWVGTSGQGVNIYNPRENRFSTVAREKDATSRFTGFSVRSVLEDNNGTVWIGTDVLFRWNRKTNEMKSYETSSNTPDDFGNTGPWSIIEDANGNIWTATSEGLYRYNPENGKTNQYKFNPDDSAGLPEKEVYSVIEVPDSSIWIVSENYLCKLINAEKGIFEIKLQLPLSANNKIVRTVIYYDNQHIFWIGTSEGLIRFDEKTQQFQTFKNIPENPYSLSNNMIKSICPDPADPESFLWIGTAGGGLNLFNKKDRIFSHITEEDGLPNNVVYGILPDNEGNLWLSTNKGLSKFNPNDVTFRNYDVKDGLQSNEFNTGAFYRAKSGELFFGGINGLNYFFPEKVIDNPNVPELVITNLKIQNETVFSGTEKSVLQKSISETERIELTHKDDIITLGFAALDFAAPEKNQYAYMLENFNDTWIYSGTVNSATFTNLPPGEYVFRVKGSNNDGIWNETGTRLGIVIKPPWWRTWWAFSFYSLVLLLLLWAIRHFEIKRVQLRDQLRLNRIETESLRKLDHLKTHFFTNISHEFRTPLTLVLGQIESVLNSDIKTNEKLKLKVANQNAEKLLSLINQLLDLAKIESGSLKLNLEEVNLIPFLKNIFYSFESLAESKNITFHFETNSDMVEIKFDPEKMERLFYNLLANALKFTEQNGTVKLSVKLQNQNEVEIKVADTGIGIPANQIPFIFDRFFQADNSVARKMEGTGIGLALAKELVELHQGEINVTSTEQKGTEFVITFPVSGIKSTASKNSIIYNHTKIQKSFNTKNELPEIQQLTIKDTAGIKKEIILVVEDNEDVRNFIGQILESGYRILTAQNGEQGYFVAENEIPDLIISDVMMPELDGFQFSKKVRNNEKTSHIPLVMLTAKAGFDDKMEGLKSGIDAFITKPFKAKNFITNR
jgi:signal transduction histidine kinase/ligand-binding sensor domain-containing protein/CheY-like chemotaxis protein